MIRTTTTPGAYVANTNIALALNKNTNNKAQLITSGTNANSINFVSTGLVDVKANVIFTPTAAGLTTMQLYADGAAVNGAAASITAEAGNTYTFNINDVISVTPAILPSVANISIKFNVAGTIVNGALIGEYRK